MKGINEFQINETSDDRICYPLLITRDGLRQRLIERHIYTPTWWRHVPDYFRGETLETHLSRYMILLPIDQRYTPENMMELADIVLEEYYKMF